ncbi:DUF2207 domain-containing protein [Streptomyces himalayensis]|uniref:DUF2207 domain-containing protein n=1 Tax=Streptomyces himalayensis subsp. himalayensis TaxID=2756131 RepID=A0A7W0DTT5_9ACTN|nr:DUF2207 domain-containing protein [Streptomyces himalayensis]MBA2951136.1 DUF2207 domain-containing protein [Streptomyces himalayensis subsp. himalayensis]
MRARSVGWRRRRDAVLLLVGAVLVGLVGLLGAVLGEPGERIARMWVGAEIRTDGTARITEVIDYDFNGEQRHGIYRDVPGAVPGDVSKVSVTADGEPVPYRVEDRAGTRIVIGDPDTTVTGTHRYRIEYTLPHLGDEEWLAWDAVGTKWDVPVGHVDVHLAVPFALQRPSCVSGSSGSHEDCATQRQPVPGQLDVAQDGLEAHEGLTLYAEVGDADGGGAASLPKAPGGRAAAVEAGESAPTGWLWATVIALAATAVVAELVRLAGRERVQGADGRTRRMDVRRLGASVTPNGEPPAGIAPAHVGILLTDRVRQEHLAAWLLTAAADGHLTISGNKKPVLHQAGERPAGAADPLTTEVLQAVFARKPRVPLGQYNTAFATAWKLLRHRLEDWRRTGGDGLWEPSGERRRRIALCGGAVAAAAGTVVVGITATDVADPGADWRTPLAVGAALAGAGLAALVRAWELRARTVRGSHLWCQAEAYRRHLAEPGRHGWEKRDEDEITAWAVALGEAEAWTAAAAAADEANAYASRTRARTAIPGDDATLRPHLATYLPLAAVSAATQPSSGGSGSPSGSSSGGYSGGGDSGGVGGGDGGGGGGSW